MPAVLASSYGANDIETAKLLSDMTGRSAINLEPPSVSGGAFGLGGRRPDRHAVHGGPRFIYTKAKRVWDFILTNFPTECLAPPIIL